MNCVFVQIRCKPGTGYRVADEIVLREIAATLKRIESRLGKIDQRMERIDKRQLDTKR